MTIAQQLNVKEFPFHITDKKGYLIYKEWEYYYWYKKEYDADGNQTKFENSTGYWQKSEYDTNGKLIRVEDSTGYWSKRQYDVNGMVIYYEDSTGTIIDERPKQVELTMDDIANKFGINVNQLKIKK
jgi:hypothetical protein